MNNSIIFVILLISLISAEPVFRIISGYQKVELLESNLFYRLVASRFDTRGISLRVVDEFGVTWKAETTAGSELIQDIPTFDGKRYIHESYCNLNDGFVLTTSPYNVLGTNGESYDFLFSKACLGVVIDESGLLMCYTQNGLATIENGWVNARRFTSSSCTLIPMIITRTPSSYKTINSMLIINGSTNCTSSSDFGSPNLYYNQSPDDLSITKIQRIENLRRVDVAVSKINQKSDSYKASISAEFGTKDVFKVGGSFEYNRVMSETISDTTTNIYSNLSVEETQIRIIIPANKTRSLRIDKANTICNSMYYANISSCLIDGITCKYIDNVSFMIVDSQIRDKVVYK